MYAFEIQTNNSDSLVIRLENLTHELMQMFVNDDSIIEGLTKEKFYCYEKYDDYIIENTRFMVLKQTKKSVVLIRIK